jgi:type VI secretion system protein ImpF
MPETVIENIQPCLFDRLIDEDPQNKQESRSARVVSIQKYRDGVMRDLRWLLNASAHLTDAEEGLADFRDSVLNYGVRDLCGQLTSNLDLTAIEHEIVEAIRFFEPRIIPGTISVRAIAEGTRGNTSTIGFEIRGDLWAAPMPEQLYIKTQIDLETGQCVL